MDVKPWMIKRRRENPAKEYLLQVSRADALINNKLADVQRLRDMATNATGYYGAEQVRSSGSQDRMADAVSRIYDLEQEINSRIDALIDLKREINATIEQLNPTEYDVLHKRYFQNMTFKAIGMARGQSEGWAKTVHGRALQSLNKILATQKKM